MICPRCGHKMRDDLLYCEKCGEEIQFVPDFEPEIEQSISDTLSEINLNDFEGDFVDDNNYNDTDEYYIDNNSYEDILINNSSSSSEEYSEIYSEESNYIENEELAYNNNEVEYDEYDKEYYDDEEYYDYEDDYEDEEEDEFLGDPFDDFEYESHLFKKFVSFIKYSKLKWVILLAIIVIAALISVGIYKFTEKMRTDNSVDYQTQLAAEAASNGDYSTAIEYMERALSLNSKDSSKKFLLSEYYFSNNEDDKALLMLWEIINEGGINSIAAYKSMINYYVAKEDYTMIEKILSSCEDEAIKLEYGNYLALEPEFSIPEGTYEDAINIVLSGDVGGTIYYTIDGSEPTYESDIFYNPIALEDLGVYTISAFYVNAYGIASDVVKKTYTIDISVPKAPNVVLDSGSYKIPLLIEVDVQNYCSVYYTTDGTLPTIFSNEYTGPIPMPIGDSHFIFVAMSQESIWGEVTEVDYNLTLESETDISEITQNLLNYSFVLGKTTDLQGHLLGNTTQYNYQISSAIAYNKNDDSHIELDHGQEGEEDIADTEKAKEIKLDDITIYYLIVEYMVDNQGNSMKTGTIYLCDIKDGTLFNATKDEEGFIYKTDEIPVEMYTLVIPENPEIINDNLEQ